ncbi:hypothetical protein ACFY9A_33530 [Streptomyces rubradiris]|uniref:hypothetical protein n=1 Tax=Streptomyces rubradiris TaxID=285531 RepID=UPI0036E1E9AA
MSGAGVWGTPQAVEDHVKHNLGNRAANALLCAVTTVIITGCSTDSAETGATGTGPTVKNQGAPEHPFDTMSPERIHHQSVAAFKNAPSMRWVGTFTNDSRQMDIDLAVDVHGSCKGTVNRDSVMHIIKKGSLVYFKAEEAFWQTSFSRGMTAEETEKMVGTFKDRWVKPPRGMSKVVGSMCDTVRAQTDALSLSSDGVLTRESDTAVDGRPAAVLVERTVTETTTEYVAKKGKPYPLRITVTGGDEPFDITFTDQGKPVDTTPPPRDQILDPTKLSAPTRRATPHSSASAEAGARGLPAT